MLCHKEKNQVQATDFLSFETLQIFYSKKAYLKAETKMDPGNTSCKNNFYEKENIIRRTSKVLSVTEKTCTCNIGKMT